MTTDPNQLPDFSFASVHPAETVLESVTAEPFREFEFDLTTSRLRVAGYNTAEAAELLSLYREHMQLMTVFGQGVQDAMRQAERPDPNAFPYLGSEGPRNGG